MAETALAAIADALEQVRIKLDSFVETASSLIEDAEIAVRLATSSEAQRALLTKTLQRTAQLKRSIEEQQIILQRLRATMAELLDRKGTT